MAVKKRERNKRTVLADKSLLEKIFIFAIVFHYLRWYQEIQLQYKNVNLLNYPVQYVNVPELCCPQQK